MKAKSLLVQIRPRSFARWRSLPLFGPLLDDFLQWMRDQHYTDSTLDSRLAGLRKVVVWLGRRRITKLAQLTQKDLEVAHDHFLPRQRKAGSVISVLMRFLRARQLVSQGNWPLPTPVEVEVERFGAYLRETRGAAKITIACRSVHLRAFLRFLRFEGKPAALQQLELSQVEAFLRKAMQTNNRSSMQQVVAAVRAYLKELHAQGVLARPLHQQIDTPRVYRGERLPRALPWAQIQAFIESIDRSEPIGRRDFTLLYLAAAYGLRSGELVRLTLDDIDWAKRVLRVRQAKTRQSLQLPLTDETANVLIDYLRKARPESGRRELFLHDRAPLIPLAPTSVNAALERRIRRSGLNLPQFSPHVLRHSFATWLMHQGVGIKAIGDALGHRDIASTSVYLRLNVDELRQVSLPVPAAPIGEPARSLCSRNSLPRIRPAYPLHKFPAHFQSRFAASLRRFVELKQGLGRIYRTEIAVLRRWDVFLHRHYPQAAKICPEIFARWTKTLGRLTSTGSRNCQRVVRNFFLFHARDHSGTFIPDRLTFPKPAPVLSPRLISEAEISRVLVVAGQLPASAENPLHAETVRIGFVLLFCCGLRRGELLRLRLGDIQEEQSVLHIRLSKFHKSRLVPLSVSVALELRDYLEKRRQKKLPMAPEAFLMWSRQRSPEPYSATRLGVLWRQVSVSAGVLNAQGHPPRLHDLRHSCAVSVLQRWYAQGADVQAKLPHLAAYLGHVNAASTHHYLKLTPELGEAASLRFHQRFASLLNKGGIA
jgi:site-specific recombinase XerD